MVIHVHRRFCLKEMLWGNAYGMPGTYLESKPQVVGATAAVTALL